MLELRAVGPLCRLGLDGSALLLLTMVCRALGMLSGLFHGLVLWLLG